MNERADAELDRQAEHAYNIMRTWHWVHYDPDGGQSASAMCLRDAVHRLVFDGHTDPKRALLHLFCNGRLSAISAYKWRKFLNGDFFYLEDSLASISIARWQALAGALEAWEAESKEEIWPCTTVDLEKLEIFDCEIAEWQPDAARLLYASVTSDLKVSDPGYSEEFYSAWDIAIMPMAMPGPDGEIVGDSEQVDAQSDQNQPDISDPPKPSLSEAELRRWWDSKANVREQLTKDELLALVRAKYPDHHISRDRVRDLAGPRKTGPKPD